MFAKTGAGLFFSPGQKNSSGETFHHTFANSSHNLQILKFKILFTYNSVA